MVAKQFQCFAMQVDEVSLQSIPLDVPIVVFANHPSWWDPIAAMLIRKRYLANRIFYAPIDADALQNYRIMAQLGFYGLRMDSLAGSSDFLTTTQAILESNNAALFITPEGRFCDVRDTTQTLMPGLSHLTSKVSRIAFVPLSFEYGFWDESRPQIFAKLGTTIHCHDRKHDDMALSKADWGELLTSRLRRTQSQLAWSVMARDPKAFTYLIESRPRRLGWYDYFRSWSARLQGKAFDPRHRGNPDG
jgi:hypothetical protein